MVSHNSTVYVVTSSCQKYNSLVLHSLFTLQTGGRSLMEPGVRCFSCGWLGNLLTLLNVLFLSRNLMLQMTFHEEGIEAV